MAVRIGHASGDENRKAKGGAAGDQTGRELRISSWYNGGWQFVARAKDPEVAERIAAAAEAGCANECIGYDQSQRNTLNTQAKKVGYDLSKITTKCETDCSAFVSVCVQAAGVDVPYSYGNAPTTSNLKNVLNKTGAFDILTDSKYLIGPNYLRRGDILCKAASHTVMVLDGGSFAEEPKPTATRKVDAAKSFSAALAGAYMVTASMLNVRTRAGTGKPILTAIPRGTVVRNYGYYTEVSGTKWLLVQFTYRGETYTGFASGKYLKKV